MLRLPKRREKPRSNIQRAPQREWPRHRKFVRSLECVCAAPGRKCAARIECCHLRLGTHTPMSVRPHDWFTFPACAEHHAQAHRVGEETFQRAYKIDLRAIALGLARQSPDALMKQAMKAAGIL